MHTEFVENHLENGNLEEPSRWQDNNEVDLTQVDCEGDRWMELAQDHNQ
jgi:hypothetical protein